MKIKVSGMTCAGCKETVTRALENIDKVKNCLLYTSDAADE